MRSCCAHKRAAIAVIEKTPLSVVGVGAGVSVVVGAAGDWLWVSMQVPVLVLVQVLVEVQVHVHHVHTRPDNTPTIEPSLAKPPKMTGATTMPSSKLKWKWRVSCLAIMPVSANNSE